MNDITKCLGIGCEDKERCQRFVEPSGSHQSWAEFYKDHINCQHYLGIKKNEFNITVQH